MNTLRAGNHLKIIILCPGIRNTYHLSKTICLCLRLLLLCFSLKYLFLLLFFSNPSSRRSLIRTYLHLIQPSQQTHKPTHTLSHTHFNIINFKCLNKIKDRNNMYINNNVHCITFFFCVKHIKKCNAVLFSFRHYYSILHSYNIGMYSLKQAHT